MEHRVSVNITFQIKPKWCHWNQIQTRSILVFQKVFPGHILSCVLFKLLFILCKKQLLYPKVRA